MPSRVVYTRCIIVYHRTFIIIINMTMAKLISLLRLASSCCSIRASFQFSVIISILLYPLAIFFFGNEPVFQNIQANERFHRHATHFSSSML